MKYPPPWMKTMTGSGSVRRSARVTTLRVRQSSLIGWYLPGASMVYMRCCGAQ